MSLTAFSPVSESNLFRVFAWDLSLARSGSRRIFARGLMLGNSPPGKPFETTVVQKQ